jgi:molybdenum cofactor cytidylyltransferase
MNSIWAIILAAGESKRMGLPKMLLDVNGASMLDNVIRNVTGAEVDNTLVVLGAEREALTDLVKKWSVKYCFNDSYKDGMLSSVKCGFRNLPPDFEAAMVFQGDQPFIFPAIINKVIMEFRSSDKGIVIPVYEKKRGHPLLIGRKYRDKIESIDAGQGLRSLAYQFSDDVLEVEISDPGILRDFDTYEEYIQEFKPTM